MRPSYGAVVAWEREGGVRTPSLWSRSLQVTLGSEGAVGGEGRGPGEWEAVASSKILHQNFTTFYWKCEELIALIVPGI